MKPNDTFPEVNFDYKTGVFLIKGRCLPLSGLENEIFEAIKDWMELYLANPCKETVLNMELTYYGTAASKFFANFLLYFETLQSKGYKVQVNWYYDPDDRDMLEDGVNYSEIVDVPFNFIEKPIEL